MAVAAVLRVALGLGIGLVRGLGRGFAAVLDVQADVVIGVDLVVALDVDRQLGQVFQVRVGHRGQVGLDLEAVRRGFRVHVHAAARLAGELVSLRGHLLASVAAITSPTWPIRLISWSRATLLACAAVVRRRALGLRGVIVSQRDGTV